MRERLSGGTPESPRPRGRSASKGETYDALLRRLIEVAEARMLYERERRILETEEFVPLDEA